MFFVQVGTLVAMGKVKVESFCSVSFEIFDFFFHRYVYWVVLHVHMTFVKIA